jgi:hypothetical protein
MNNHRNDEARYNHSAPPVLPTQSQQQSHQNVNHPTQTTSFHTDPEKDISYDTEPTTTNQKSENSHFPNLHKSFESPTAGNTSSTVTTNHTNTARNNSSIAQTKNEDSKPAHIIHHPIPIKPASKIFQPAKQAQNDININSPTRFNSNPFFSILESSKLKYSSLETYLSKQTLPDDTYHSLEQFYTAIVRSLNMAFSAQVYFMPAFQQLRPETSFHSIFLDGLFGANYDKGFTIFATLGQFIKDRLLHKDCLQRNTAPKSFILISAFPTLDGWSLLENLLKKRLVQCGALPETDLDTIRSNLVLQPDESIHDFLHRTQQLENEYMLQLAKHPQLVPRTKILRRFISELMRAQEYQSYVVYFERELTNHMRKYGEQNLDNHVPFTLMDIYESMSLYSIPDVPTKLTPSRNILSPVPTSNANSNSPLAHIATGTIDENLLCQSINDDWYSEVNASDMSLDNPNIGAMQRNQRQRLFCQCCMTSGHDADHCFLRGKHFRPDALNKRINVYNQQHGDKPPKSAEIKPWNPRSPPPIMNKSSSEHRNNDNLKKKSINPFTNAKSKSNGPTANAIVTENEYPSISSFIHNQDSKIVSFLDTIEVEDTDSDDNSVIIGTFSLPIITSISSTTSKINTDIHDLQHPFSSTTVISNYTPTSIINHMKQVHQSIPHPSQSYLSQYAKAFHNLPSSSFLRLGKMYFQVDTGANVHAVTNSNMLIFFINCKTKVRNINGETFESPGWGACIFTSNNKNYLLSPVYVCPNNPHNTISLGALQAYTSFKRTVVETHLKLELYDHFDHKHQVDVITDNGLDYVDLQLSTFNNQQVSINNIATDFKQVHSISSLHNEEQFIFPRHVMAHISAFYIHLHPNASPRVDAINNMNKLLNIQYSPPILQHIQRHISLYTDTKEATNDNDFLTNATSEKVIPIMGKLFRSTPFNKHPPLQTYMLIHLLCQHASKSSIMTMYKEKSFKDMPNIKDVHKIECICKICLLTKSTKVPRGKITDVTKLSPFKRLHCDFSFFGITSLRGYTTAFDLACASTSYTFGFPSKTKGPPINIFTWVIKTLRSMGYEVIFIRVDEDSSLARSSEFCSQVIKLNCVLETTGGGNSENNGKVERPNRIKGDMVRSSLATAKKIFGHLLPSDLPIQKFWCFAYSHANYTLRRLYNRMRKTSPYFLVHHELPSINDLCIFGSFVTIVDPNKKQLGKLNEKRAKTAYFLTFGNNTSNIVAWDPNKPYTWLRAHHAIIDEVSTFNKIQDSFTTNQLSDPTTNKINCDENNVNNNTADVLLPMKTSPFDDDEIKSVTITIPPTTKTLGFHLLDDHIYNLPYILECTKGSFAWDALPPKYRRHAFIININNEGPITAEFAIKLIKEAQLSDTKLQMDLVKRNPKSITSLSMSRAMFDQLPSLHPSRPIISTISAPPLSHAHFISAPHKPKAPKSFFDCLKGPFQRAFRAAAKIQFDKNRKVVVFSKPFPKSELQKDDRVFRTLLVPGFKDTDMPGVYECRVRDCTVGTPQVKGLDFPESYCATIDSTTYRLVFALSAMNGNRISIVDVKNAFQTSIAPPEYRIYVTIPPLYLDWLEESEDLKFDRNIQYVRQMLNANQGTKSASHIWYWLLVPILTKYGFIRSTIDHAFFILSCGNEKYFYICLATDDLLCSHPNDLEFKKLVKYLSEYFDLSVQEGHVLKFLSIRVIQSDHGISLDQGEYIYSLLLHYFGDDIDKIKTARTPMRTDSQFEKELHMATPLSESELVAQILKHKGSPRFHFGKFQYATGTRPDIQFAVHRMSEYAHQPSLALFACINQVYRYLATDILRPIMYPRKPLSGRTTLSHYITPHQQIKLTIPNTLQLFADAELARNLSDRKSYYCIVMMINGVYIEFKTKKTTTIMTHTTDAETKAQFVAVRRLQPVRRLLESMGYPCLDPTPAYTDNSAVSAIIDANRMTPRCRHIDIPIAYLHQEKDKSFSNHLIRTIQMIADLGTKPLVMLLHKRLKYWITGEQFLPAKGTLHYQLLEMDLYEVCFVDFRSVIERRNDTT